MLALEERFMIRELYHKGVSISEIARRTGRDRKTIRHIATAPDLSPPKPERQAKACKIDAYAPYLERRIAEGVLNARKLYAEILAQGYPGKESKVREFVHDRRPEKEPSGSIRFETAPGEQGQVDWGHFGFITHHGRTCRLYAFVMTLGWSRARLVCALRLPRIPPGSFGVTCMRLRTWEAFPGACSMIISKVWWRGVMQTRWCIGIPAFSTLPMWQGSARKRGLPYRPQTKGKVENGVKYVRGNFWPGLHFRDLEDLNTQALTWLNTTANPRVHGTTGEVPFTRLRLEGLQPATKAFSYDTSVMTTRRSSKDCLISYEGNLYSVPAAYARKTLQVNITEAGELVICSQLGQELARHRVLLGRRERSVQADRDLRLGFATPPQERASALQELLPTTPSPFWDAPVVEVRPLSAYDQVLWEVSR